MSSSPANNNDGNDDKDAKKKDMIAAFQERVTRIGERNAAQGRTGKYSHTLLSALYARSLSGKVKEKVVTNNRDRAPPPQRQLAFTGTIGKYTHTLFSDASKAGQLDAVERELKRLVDEFDKNAKLRDTMTSPVASKDTKLSAIREMASKTNCSDLVTKLAERMVGENRARDLKKLATDFGRLVAEKKGLIPAVVYSAEPLSTEQIQRIEGKVSKLLEPGQKLVLSAQINPKLLGGLKIRLGDRELDLSVASKIQNFERAFRASLFA
jgi:F-type H+-transporting ATPase subunit delta